MTPEELRALADEQAPGGWSVYWEDFDSGGELYRSRWIEDADGVLLSLDPADLHERRALLIALAPDLARLCAALGEALEEAHARLCGCELPGGDDDPNPWACFAGKEFRVLTKLSALESVT